MARWKELSPATKEEHPNYIDISIQYIVEVIIIIAVTSFPSF